ncbi:MAG: PhzF family phenazine biosynthesis protein [Alphaproteobacteria bacterium]
MIDLDIYQVDAFADRPFAGNPAAVVPLESWLPDVVLQGIAAENNLAETAFFIEDNGDADFHLRWFTPTVEVDLCGHATLASGSVLFNHRGWPKDRIVFQSRSGPLAVSRDGDRYLLDFPSKPAVDVAMPDGLADAIGCVPQRYLRATMNMAILESESAVLAVNPDLAFIAAMEGDGLIVSAPGDTSDCASRYFAPHAGIDEDPVTGSAHCTIVPYWADVLDRKDIYARQVSKRGGDLYCRLEGDRVSIAGNTALYLTGRIRV